MLHWLLDKLFHARERGVCLAHCWCQIAERAFEPQESVEVRAA